ncbi:MAG: hypothetical protein ACPLTR_04125 [Thermacetogeniaceae bacterium]
MNGLNVRLKVGKVDTSRTLAAVDWMLEGHRFSVDMPDVLIEEEASEPGMGSREETTAVVNFFSHFPESPLVDCAVVFLRAGDERLGKVTLWPNPALGSKAPSALDEALIRVMQAKNVVKACVVKKKLPFPADGLNEELPALGITGGADSAGMDVSLDEIFKRFRSHFKGHRRKPDAR